MHISIDIDGKRIVPGRCLFLHKCYVGNVSQCIYA